MINIIKMLTEKGYKPTFSKYETDHGRVYQCEVGNSVATGENFEELEESLLWLLDLDTFAK